MKTIKQQTREAIEEFHKSFGHNKGLREKIQKDLKEQDQTELWQLEDAIADFKIKFNPYQNE